MDGQNGEATNAVNATEPATSRTRQRSSIAFPYMDMDAAIELAKAIHGNVGHGICDDNQLAAWSNQSPKSSTFRSQVYAARTFGILAGEGNRHELTPLGQAIVDPERERKARADAFLTVPLFKAVYEKYLGAALPPTAALEREMALLGVADKQKSRARQVFERSAEEAGFFEHGKTRLVMPGINAGGAITPPVNRVRSSEGGKPSDGGASGGRGAGTGGGTGGGSDPLIGALIDKLPPTDQPWPADDRVNWLKMLVMAFQVTYGTDSEIQITKNEAN